MPSDLIPPARLTKLLDGARGKHIVVVGDAMLDVYLRGEVDRVSPEAPVPVVRVRERRMALGGAANVAQNAAALGAKVTLVAAVGRDEAAGSLKKALAAIGAGSGGLVEVARATTTKTRVVARGQQLLRIDEETDDDFTGTDAAKIADAVERAVGSADAVVLEDYNKGVLVVPVIERALAAAKKRGIPVVVDPKYKNFFAYSGATVFKPNRRELESALGAAVDIDHPETLPAMVERLGVDALLLTLSERGMALIERAESGSQANVGANAMPTVHRIPTTAREVYDVVGAGDTVTAYLAAMLAAGATPLEAAIIANFAAGVEVGKSGAATVLSAEVIAAYDQHRADA